MVFWQKSGYSGRRSERAKQQQESIAYSIAFQHRGLTRRTATGACVRERIGGGLSREWQRTEEFTWPYIVAGINHHIAGWSCTWSTTGVVRCFESMLMIPPWPTGQHGRSLQS
jgi:hypothetical protein